MNEGLQSSLPQEREKKKNTKITDFLLHKNVCGIKQIQKRGTPLA